MESQSLPTFRPLRLGELLDRAIRLYRRNFLTFIGIIALVYVPLTIFQTASSAIYTGSLSGLLESNDPETIFTNFTYWLGLASMLVTAFLQVILVQGVAAGALTRAIADNYLGKTATVIDSYRGIGKLWLPLVGALLFIGVVFIAVSIWWIVIPCVGWLTGLGMIAFLTMAVNPLVPSVVVIEGRGAVESVRRAWTLSRRRFWPVLGTILVLALFSAIVVNGPAAIANVILVALIPENLGTGLVITTIIQSLVTLIFTLLYYPLYMTAFTVIYFDLRVRTEGLDIAFHLEGTADAPDVSRALAVPVSQTDERLITGADLGNFAILTLAAAGIYIFLVSFILSGAYFLGSLLSF